MPEFAANMMEPVGGFEIKGMMMRYNLFAPRLYNWCRSLGFEANKIMPSRAFCSDESQGYPIIMIAKHFGTFPFNHGVVGGIVATDRHGPHAGHGQDIVIIQASHVGYDPETKTFGIYRRLQTSDQSCGPNCGKIQLVIEWYELEYQFAQKQVLLHKCDGQACITIDNLLLKEDREEGLFLRLDKLIEGNTEGQRTPLSVLSTAKIFKASTAFVNKVGKSAFEQDTPRPIGADLSAGLIYYQRDIPTLEEGAHHLEYNLIRYMPQIVTSNSPILTAAQINIQIEFDRTFRSIVKEKSYQGKKVLFVSGLNIDISPQTGQVFPLTKFVPWAAYIQERDGTYRTLEQREVMAELGQQSTDNPDQIDLEDAIQAMTQAEEVKIEL